MERVRALVAAAAPETQQESEEIAALREMMQTLRADVAESDIDAAERDKLIKVKAYIKTESGSAVIRLRMDGKVLEYTPDADGRFEHEFNFENGGNYIMIDFDRFTGTVQMTAEYV